MIGLGIVTYNRLDYLKQCVDSVVKNNYGSKEPVVFIIVDDCSTDGTVDWLKENYPNNHITKPENKGVANSKNICLEYMMNMGCEHLFLMEDDIVMTSNITCDYYIRYAKAYKLHHLNFAHHGVMNINGKSNYGCVDVYPNCIGAFSYYTRECIDKVGYMDENFKNAWEHVEHTYRIAKEGLTTPFWKFADCCNSDKLLKELPNSIDNSVIRPRKDFEENILKGQKYWIKKHGSWLPPRI